MNNLPIQYSRFTKARYFITIVLAYMGTTLFTTHIVRPGVLFKDMPLPSTALAAELPKPPVFQQAQVISGTPTKIALPSLGLDITVDPGIYNSIDHTWTLSPSHAHFAEPSMPPNNKQGNTLIYGHNNDYVFGLLRNIHAGDTAIITADNGHRFYYSFVSAENVKPDNMIVFQYQGPPTLVIQTCTGNWNEWRKLSTFKLIKVE